jgi:hypothetical protein
MKKVLRSSERRVSNRPKKYKPTTKPKCGAITRGTDVTNGTGGDGHPCRRVAGHGTDHLGSGRCKYHAGSTPRKHGLYSKVVPLTMKQSYQAALTSGDPKSMLEHIALIDSVILPGALKRGEKAPKHAGETDPLMLQMMAIDTKSKVLKRMHDLEDSQKIKFTEAELKMLVMEIVSIIAEFVNADTLRKITARFGARASLLEAH